MPNWCHNVIDVKSIAERVADVRKLILRDGEVNFEIVAPMPEELRGAYSFDEDSLTLSVSQSNPDRVGINIVSTLSNEDIADIDIVFNDPDIDMDGTVEDNLVKLVNATAPELLSLVPKRDIHWAWSTKLPPSLKLLLDYIADDHAAWCAEEFGYPNWYAWCLVNWGTKWNSIETEVNTDCNGADPTYLQIQFDTAWAPPRAWFEELCRVVNAQEGPVVELFLEYCEPGDGFGGRLEYSVAGGDIVQTSFNEAQQSEFLYGDSEYIADERALEVWDAAPHDFEDEVLLDDEFSDNEFTDEELEEDGQA